MICRGKWGQKLVSAESCSLQPSIPLFPRRYSDGFPDTLETGVVLQFLDCWPSSLLHSQPFPSRVAPIPFSVFSGLSLNRDSFEFGSLGTAGRIWIHWRFVIAVSLREGRGVDILTVYLPWLPSLSEQILAAALPSFLALPSDDQGDFHRLIPPSQIGRAS